MKDSFPDFLSFRGKIAIFAGTKNTTYSVFPRDVVDMYKKALHTKKDRDKLMQAEIDILENDILEKYPNVLEKIGRAHV